MATVVFGAHINAESGEIRIYLPDLEDFAVSCDLRDDNNNHYSRNDAGFVIVPATENFYQVRCTATKIPGVGNSPAPNTIAVLVTRDKETVDMGDRANPTKLTVFQQETDGVYRMNWANFYVKLK